MLGSWRIGDDRIALESIGNGSAEIIYTSASGDRDVFGRADYDADRGHHVIEWGGNGRMALEQYKRDYLESKFYYTLARAA